MPLFGRSKKAQDAKKQPEEPAAPKPAPYRHVPRHAASDARNHGLAEDDKLAQQQRIMAASQQRLNSMNSNHSVKSSFTNVPVNGSQAKASMFGASHSSRHSIGNATGRDGSAVRPGSPAGPVQPNRRAQEEYVKLRNPSLLSNITFPGESNPKPVLAVKNPTAASDIRSHDSGYGGSVEHVPRPESKAPSTASRAPSEFRKSQEVRFAPTSTTGSVDFLPKLDFAPENSRSTPAADQPASPAHSGKPISIVTTRDRAVSNSSSYVSRLDPGSDRRSIASFQSKPFDQIDFSKPGQQFIPSPTRTTNRTSTEFVRPSTDSARFALPESPTIQSTTRRPPPPEPSIDQHAQQPAITPKNVRPEPQDQSADSEPFPHFAAEPKSPRRLAEETRQKTMAQDQFVEHKAADESKEQPIYAPIAEEAECATPRAVAPPDQSMLPPKAQTEPSETQPGSQVEDERGRRTPPASVSAFPSVEESRRSSSTSQTRRSDHSKLQTGRVRNWSRPSQASSSLLDYERKESSSGVSVRSAALATQTLPENDDYRESYYSRDPEREARDLYRIQTGPYQRTAPIEHSAQVQDQHRWNDQGSSIYGESAYNTSTRQHSPSRRQSFAPSEVLDQGQAGGKPALAPLSILDGLKVNKRGKILDEEGDAIGELIEGDIIDCVRQKANAFGQVLDDYGRIVGRVTTTNRGGDVQSHSPATTVRSAAFSDFRPDFMQPYGMPETQTVNSAKPKLGKPFERTVQEEDPRQRAADLEAAAARRHRRSPAAHIELDGSGYAEAAPLVDHSEIFAPPFIPSRSPKRSPAEVAHHGMDSYFSPPPVREQPPAQEPPRLKKWASRNLEEDREEMQRSQQASQPTPVAPQPPSEHDVSRPSTADGTPNERDFAVPQRQPSTNGQDFISSDQPKDIFPWMTNPAAPPQETGKWSSNLFKYKGEIPSEDANGQAKDGSVRGSAAQPQTQSALATNSAPLMKHYLPHLSGASAGSRKSNRTSFREHVPHVKSPLSTHNITPPDTSAGAPTAAEEDGGRSTSRPASTHTTTSTSTRTKTYFTHGGKQSVVVPDAKPTHTGAAPPAAAAEQAPLSPMDGAMAPPDVVRTKGEAKRRSRWSMGFGKKAPPVQNPLKK